MNATIVILAASLLGQAPEAVKVDEKLEHMKGIAASHRFASLSPGTFTPDRCCFRTSLFDAR